MNTNEIFKPIKWATQYEVSNRGRIRNISTGKFLKPGIVTKGYLSVCLVVDKYGRGVSTKVHRIVAETFHGNQKGKGMVIDHIDDDKSNNSATNLRYVTNRYNVIKQKLHSRGGICSVNSENKHMVSYTIEYRKHNKRHSATYPTELECVVHYCDEIADIDYSVVELLENHYGFKLNKQAS